MSPYRLATHSSRLMATIIDTIPVVIFVAPKFGITLNGILPNLDDGLRTLGLLLLFIVQTYLLVKSGQTIGKGIMGIQIVRVEDGRRASWQRTVLLRSIVNSVISVIPIVGWLYVVIDALFIFRSDRRCAHDLIAGTLVVPCPVREAGDAEHKVVSRRVQRKVRA